MHLYLHFLDRPVLIGGVLDQKNCYKCPHNLMARSQNKQIDCLGLEMVSCTFQCCLH